jgi:hypothetical protein
MSPAGASPPVGITAIPSLPGSSGSTRAGCHRDSRGKAGHPFSPTPRIRKSMPSARSTGESTTYFLTGFRATALPLRVRCESRRGWTRSRSLSRSKERGSFHWEPDRGPTCWPSLYLRPTTSGIATALTRRKSTIRYCASTGIWECSSIRSTGCVIRPGSYSPCPRITEWEQFPR